MEGNRTTPREPTQTHGEHAKQAATRAHVQPGDVVAVRQSGRLLHLGRRRAGLSVRSDGDENIVLISFSGHSVCLCTDDVTELKSVVERVMI